MTTGTKTIREGFQALVSREELKTHLAAIATKCRTDAHTLETRIATFVEKAQKNTITFEEITKLVAEFGGGFNAYMPRRSVGIPAVGLPFGKLEAAPGAHPAVTKVLEELQRMLKATQLRAAEFDFWLHHLPAEDYFVLKPNEVFRLELIDKGEYGAVRMDTGGMSDWLEIQGGLQGLGGF